MNTLPNPAATPDTSRPDAAARTNGSQSATSPLLQVVLSFLIPLMLAAGLTDTELARQAAQQAIAGYGGPLLNVAQVVAMAMASLDNLRLAVPPDRSLTLKLRLRANANALARTSAKMQQQPPEAAEHPAPEAADPGPEPEPIAIRAPEPVPAGLPPQQHQRCEMANSMDRIALELRSQTGPLSAAERRKNRLWVEVLAEVSTDLRANPAPNSFTRSHLLSTTTLSNSTFPFEPLMPKR